jgi:hypothetical protein
VVQRQGDVERRRTGVIAHARADPADAGRLGLFDRKMRGAAHHQVAHGIVAVDECRRGPVADHADVGFGIDAAGANAAHIKRQPDHAMSIAAAQIGLDHEASDGFRIRLRQACRGQSADDEGGEPVGGNARIVRGHAGHASLAWQRLV